MKKTIWSFAAIALLGGAITLVACSKENDITKISNPSTPAAKSSSTLQNLNNRTVEFLQYIDAAYAQNATQFMNICSSGDIAAFSNFIQVPDTLENKMVELTNQAYQEFLQMNPGVEFAEGNYGPEGDNPLEHFAQVANTTNGNSAGALADAMDRYRRYSWRYWKLAVEKYGVSPEGHYYYTDRLMWFWIEDETGVSPLPYSGNGN